MVYLRPCIAFSMYCISRKYQTLKPHTDKSKMLKLKKLVNEQFFFFGREAAQLYKPCTQQWPFRFERNKKI